MSDDLYTALVLAGDRGPDDPVAAAAGVKRKALAVVAGRPMLAYVIEALSESRSVGQILIVANQVADIRGWAEANGYAERSDIAYFEGAASPVASVEKTIDEEGARFPLLVVGADGPLIEAADIDAFLGQARAQKEAQILVALAPESDFRQQFPDTPRTFIKLGREGYSGCNMFALQSAEVGPALRFWKKIESERKKALRLVAAFGLWSLVRVKFGWMDLERAFERASKVLGVTVRPYLVGNPHLAMDVDAPVHLAIVEDCLAATDE